MASPSPESPQRCHDERPFLTPEQVTFFHENGYLLIPDFLSENDMQNMREAIIGQLDKFDPQEHRSIFTTVEQKRVVDAYFLESGDKIRYFFEEDAFDASGELVSDKYHVINKIGHDLHNLDPIFKRVSYDPRINSIARSLGSKQPLIAQSMYIFKQPRIGGEVKPHQDATFLYTEPQSVLGFWWPLEKCTKQNGCLWAVPGSHKLPVFQHFRRTRDSTSCEMIPPTAEPFNIEGIQTHTVTLSKSP